MSRCGGSGVYIAADQFRWWQHEGTAWCPGCKAMQPAAIVSHERDPRFREHSVPLVPVTASRAVEIALLKENPYALEAYEMGEDL